MSERINSVASQINSLLCAEVPVKPLVPETETKALVPAGLRCHYEIAVKRQQTPLRVKVVSHSRATDLALYFSHKTKRPSKETSEKVMLVKSQLAYLSYKSDNKQKYFTERFLYLTIESEKECACTLAISFGTGSFFSANADKPLANANASTPSNKDENKDFDLFMSPRRSRVLRIRPYSKKTKKEILEVKKHRTKVIYLSKKKSNEELCKKFMLCHKAELKERIVEIAQKELRKLNKVRRIVGYWIHMAMVIKFAAVSYKKYVRLKKKKAADTLRLYKAIRIYMFLKANLSIDSLGFKDRVKQKILLYLLF